jgi:dipeptidase E
MKFYLSSFRIGDHGEHLRELSKGGPLAYIPNALDHISAEDQRASADRNGQRLLDAGIAFELFDLKNFFSSPTELGDELKRFTGVWVTGGNTFVLRQAMRLSGFDEAIKELIPTSFLYSGYSAGICVLAPDLKALQIVDDPKMFPYPAQTEVIWEGLNILDYMILPHYRSDHPESKDIDREVEYCENNNIPFKTLRDGEAIFGDDISRIKRNIGLSP